MGNIKPPNIPLTKTKPGYLRIGPFLGKHSNNPRAVLVGFPSDEGVKRNRGRAGASKAPAEIRKILYKITPDAENKDPFINLLEHTNDLGDVNVSGDLEADQEALGSMLAEYLKKEVIPIILGGGHETAFGHFLGYVKANFKTSIFNIDAHTDVRPLKNGKAHSGSPFRQAMEHESKSCEKYLVAGLQPHSVSKSHLEYIRRNDGKYLFREETNSTSISELFNTSESERLMVTFDMDAVDQAFAPGVSAPCTNGLQPDLWLKAAYLAGRNKQVTSFDLSEVNPKFDRDGQTARLAALTIWHFLLGLSQRK